MQKTNEKELTVEKVIKKKGDKLYVKCKGYDSSSNRCIDKKRCNINEQIFPRTEFSGKNSESWIRLSNYITKADLKNLTGFDKSKFAKKVGIVNLKPNVDKLDIDKLKDVPTNFKNLKRKVDKLDVDKLIPVRVDLSKLCDVVKNHVVKKLCI